MRKEELRNLKRINATPKMVRMAGNNDKEMRYESIYEWWDDKVRDTEYDLFVRCQTRGTLLMVCIFFPKKITSGELTPTYEIYCNPQGDEYITRYLEKGEEQGWRTAMVDNLEEISGITVTSRYYTYAYPRFKDRIWQNPEGKKTIQKFMGTDKDGIWGLVEWQRKVKEKNVLAAEAREKAPWDADMKLIPEIMPSFGKWMMKEAADEHYIIYEYDPKGAEKGWCSCCQKMVPVATEPRHNKGGYCKKCRKDITYKAAGKIKTLSTGWYTGKCIQKLKGDTVGGIVIRGFEQRQWYRDADYRVPETIMRETERILIWNDGRVKRYHYDLYKNKEHRFILDKTYFPSREYHHREKLYRKNIKSLKETVLRDSTIDMWEDGLPTTVTNYLAVERGNPSIEKLVKTGMFKLAADMIHVSYQRAREMIDQEATELNRMLKIDKSRLKRLREIRGGIVHLEWYQYEKMIDTVWTDGMIQDFGNADIRPGSLGFLPLPLRYVKIWNYMKKQKEISGRPFRRIIQTWQDYINMAEQEKMDVASEMIWRPKDLQKAHDDMVLFRQRGKMEEQAKKLEKKWPKVNGILPDLQKFEYADGRFAVLAPKSILDIVREGTALHHCVHTCDFYFDRIQKHETYLFFLRRAGRIDIPWYTLEVEAGGNIRQKRTTGDNQGKDLEEAVAFLKKWQEVFVKRMTEEERAFGAKADQARQEEYKKLREDGNKVWHGRLAGKLLADVLEEDFMAAI